MLSKQKYNKNHTMKENGFMIDCKLVRMCKSERA